MNEIVENQIKLTRRNSCGITLGIFFSKIKMRTENNITPKLTSSFGDPVPPNELASSFTKSVDSKYPKPPGKKENTPSEIN